MLALICGLVPHIDAALFIGGIAGALIGAIIGFLADSAPLAKTTAPTPSRIYKKGRRRSFYQQPFIHLQKQKQLIPPLFKHPPTKDARYKGVQDE